MKYNGMDYNDYLVEEALNNMDDKEFAEMMVADKKTNEFYKSM